MKNNFEEENLEDEDEGYKYDEWEEMENNNNLPREYIPPDRKDY